MDFLLKSVEYWQYDVQGNTSFKRLLLMVDENQLFLLLCIKVCFWSFLWFGGGSFFSFFFSWMGHARALKSLQEH